MMKKEHIIQVVLTLNMLILCNLHIKHLDCVRIINNEFCY